MNPSRISNPNYCPVCARLLTWFGNDPTCTRCTSEGRHKSSTGWLVLMFVWDDPTVEEIVEVETPNAISARRCAFYTRNMPSSWGIRELVAA